MNIQELKNKIKSDALQIIKKSEKKIPDLIKTKKSENHFIPVADRVYSNVIQSMVIKYGTVIENIIRYVIENSDECEIVSGYENNAMNYSFKVPYKEDDLISEYISNAKNVENYKAGDEIVAKHYDELIGKIRNYKVSADDEIVERQNDIDLLFRTKNNPNDYYYVEIKYKDNHDSGKNEDIARKLLRTDMYISTEYANKEVNIIPMLYFFTPTNKKNNYLPKKAVLSGRELFDKFNIPAYDEMLRAMDEVSSDPEIVNEFKRIREETYSLCK